MANTTQGGMHQDNDPIFQPTGTVRFALNGTTSQYEGDVGTMWRELGTKNIYSALFADYKIIGFTLLPDRTVILYSVYNGVGRIEKMVKKYSEYRVEPIISSSCLNFDEHHPITSSHYRKLNGCDDVIYFNDFYNPMRSINLNKLESYLNSGETVETANLTTTGWDCSKFIHFRGSLDPLISLSRVRDRGGRLRSGMYFFALRYSNDNGEVTDFSNISDGIPIHDGPQEINAWSHPFEFSYSIVGGYPQLDSNGLTIETDKQIELDIRNLDTSYDYYQLAVIEYIEGVGAMTNVYLSGTMSIPSNGKTKFNYKGFTTNYSSISLADILIPKIKLNEVHSIAALNNRMFFANAVEKNYNWASMQQAFCKVKPTWTAEDRIAGDYRLDKHDTSTPNFYVEDWGAMRDEVYAIGVAVVLNDGTTSPVFHIPGPAADNPDRLADIALVRDTSLNQGQQQLMSSSDTIIDKAILTVVDTPPNDIESGTVYIRDVEHLGLSVGDEIERWKVFNTAFATVSFPYSFNGDTMTKQNGRLGYYECADSQYPESKDCKGNYIYGKDAWGNTLAGSPVRHCLMPTTGISPHFSQETYSYGSATLMATQKRSVLKLVLNNFTLPAEFAGKVNQYIFCRGEFSENDNRIHDKGWMAQVKTDKNDVLNDVGNTNFGPNGEIDANYVAGGNFLDWNVGMANHKSPMQIGQIGFSIVQNSWENDYLNKNVFSLWTPGQTYGVYDSSSRSLVKNNSLKEAIQIESVWKGEFTPKGEYPNSTLNWNKTLYIREKLAYDEQLDHNFLKPKDSYIVAPRAFIETKYGSMWNLNNFDNAFYGIVSTPVDFDERLAVLEDENGTSDNKHYISIRNNPLNSFGDLSEIKYIPVKNSTRVNNHNIALKDCFINNLHYFYFTATVLNKDPEELVDSRLDKMFYGSMSSKIYGGLEENAKFIKSNNLEAYNTRYNTDFLGGMIEERINMRLAYGENEDPNKPIILSGYVYNNDFFYSDLLHREFLDSNGDSILGRWREINLDYTLPSILEISSAIEAVPKNYSWCDSCGGKRENNIYFSDLGDSTNTNDSFNIIRALNQTVLTPEDGPILNLYILKDNLFAHTQKAIVQVPTREQALESMSGDIIVAGSPSVLATPPKRLQNNPLGYMGIPAYNAAINTEYGLLAIDVNRKKIFMFNYNGGGIEEISLKGIARFARENLAFSILEQMEGYVDYSYFNTTYANGFGYSIVYDESRDLIFIHKKDYALRSDLPLQFDGHVEELPTATTADPTTLVYSTIGRKLRWWNGMTEVFFPDNRFFVNKSFTLSYSPRYKSFISFHSFAPSIMFNIDEYFASQQINDSSIWKHGIGLPSNYYDVQYSHIIEFVAEPDAQTGVFSYLEFFSDSEVNKMRQREKTFNQIWVYNDEQSSGIKNLEPMENGLNYLSNFVYGNSLSNSSLFFRFIEGHFRLNRFSNAHIAPFTENTYLDAPEDVASEKDFGVSGYQGYIDKIPNSPSLDPNKNPFQIDRLRSKYLKIRLIITDNETVTKTSILKSFKKPSIR